MVTEAPTTSTATTPAERNPAYTAPSVVVCGAGGCGINIARMVAHHLKQNADATNQHQDVPVKFFDTSMANTRPGESVSVITGGSGSGGVRGSNANAIVKEVAALGDDVLIKADVAIVISSLSGGK